MKILQLIPNISGGGAERFTVDLSNELSADNDVSLLTLYDSRDRDLFREELNNNISTYSVGKELGFDYKIFRKLYHKIDLIKPDVIHSHLRSINYLIPIQPFFNIPVFYTMHGYAYADCPNKYIRLIRRVFFKKKSVIPVTISGKSEEGFQKVYPGIESELINIGRSHPAKSKNFQLASKQVEALKRNRQSKVFVHIGRITPEKNQLMLVEAFNKVVYGMDVNGILLIIGGGRNTDESRQIQEQLQKAEQEHDHIHLLGEQLNATDYLHLADYFCLSSLYESMSITFLEALATGTIPICTPVGVVPEVAQYLDKALLADSVEEGDYVQALKNTLDIPPDKREELKKQAVSLFRKKYSMKHCAEKYLKLFKRMSK